MLTLAVNRSEISNSRVACFEIQETGFQSSQDEFFKFEMKPKNVAFDRDGSIQSHLKEFVMQAPWNRGKCNLSVMRGLAKCDHARDSMMRWRSDCEHSPFEQMLL